MPDSELALVFAADEGFARPLAVAMHSALEHLSPGARPEIYVLDNGLSDATRARIGHSVAGIAGREIHWLHVAPDRLMPHRGAPGLTATSYARLLIPDLLPAHVRRAVYLDLDVLVLADVAPLFSLDLDGAPFGAVRDFTTPSTDHEWCGIPAPHRTPDRPYFNTGVLALDVAQWRETGFADRVLAYVHGLPEPPYYADQDAINVVAERWFEMDFRWNVQLIMYHVEGIPRSDLTDQLRRRRGDLYRDAAILHFSGTTKPWRWWPVTPGGFPWARALKRSGWHTREEYLRWLLPWAAKRAILGGSRRLVANARRAARAR